VSDPGGPPYPPHPHADQPPPAQTACVRHPDRPTGLRCARCDRPACPECLREASVGYQCVDCVAEGARGTRSARTVVGGSVSDKPLVVPALIAVNTAVFLLTVVQAASLQDNYRAGLFRDWVLYPPSVAGGEWWRLLTAGFLHYGPIHLLFNMLALWFIGRDLELVLGRGRFLAVYLTSLLGGSAAAFLFGAVNTQVAGASGAVFGLMGGLAVVLKRLRRPPGPAFTLIAVNVVISIVLPGLSLLGHLGGLVVGVAATAALLYAPARNRQLWQAGGVGGLVVLLAVAMMARAAVLSPLLG
jgi:membrane associated rhomboid family serine protease